MRIKQHIGDILKVANRETGRLAKGKMYWFCMVIAPLITALFFLSLMHEGLPTKLPVALVDLDNSSASRNLARQLNAFTEVDIVMQAKDFNEAVTEMQKGNVYGIYFIPYNFGTDAATGKQPTLSFYTNNSYMIAGSLLFKDMKTVSTLAGGSVALQAGRAKGYTDAQIMAQVQPITIDMHPIGNPWLNYSFYMNNFIIPGVLALLIMCVTVYNIGIEIKEHTSTEWLGLGGGSILKSLSGKILPQTIVFFVVGLIIFLVLYAGLQFPVYSGIGPMILALLMLILASQALGIFMIGILPTLRLGLSFACIWGMISFSAAGFSFPVRAMYAPIQALTNLFPLRHYFVIFVDQALNGRELYYSQTSYLALAAFLLLPFLVMSNLKYSLLHSSYKP